MNLRHLKLVFAFALVALAYSASAAITLTDCRTQPVTKNLPCEITLTATANPLNPYTSLTVTGTFTNMANGKSYPNVAGFYDGQSAGNKPVFKIRFTPQLEGQWHFSTSPSPADAGLTASGTFIAAASNARGFLRRSDAWSEDPVFDNEERPFLWGMTYYQIVNTALATGPNGFWKSTVDTVFFNHSINKIRLLVFPWWDEYSGQFNGAYVDSVPFATLGCSTPRTCLNHDKLRVDHFRALDDVVNHLHTRGMVAELVIFKDHALGANNAIIDGKRTFGTVPQDQRYTRYVLARYAAFPNVTWCLTNEYNSNQMPPKTPYWDTDIGLTVRANDPYFVSATSNAVRFSSIHARATQLFEFYANRASAFNNQWASHVVMQFHQNNGYANPEQWGWQGVRSNLSYAAANGLTMPVSNDEYGYVGKVTPAVARAAAWGVAVAGGYGTMGDTRPVPNTVTPNGLGAQTSMRAAWVPGNVGAYNDIKYLIDFFRNPTNDPAKYEYFYLMRYLDNVVSSGDRTVVGGWHEWQYVIYDANGGAVRVNLPHPGTDAYNHYTVRVYNPRTGVWGAPTTIGYGSNIALPVQTSGNGIDWVYLIKEAP